jgi:hypothetical protein
MTINPWKSLPNRDSVAKDRDRAIFLHKKDLNNLASKQKEA